MATVSLVGLEPDQIPQLWLYVLNSTALSAGGISLTTTGTLPLPLCSGQPCLQRHQPQMQAPRLSNEL